MVLLRVLISLSDQVLHAFALSHRERAGNAECVQKNRETDENDQQRNEDIEQNPAALRVPTI